MDLPKVNLDTLRAIPVAHKAAGLGLLLAVIGVGFWFYSFDPLKTEITKLDGEFTKLEQEIQNLTIKVKHLDELIAAHDALEKELESRKASLPPREEAATLLKEVTDLAIGKGLDIKLWKPGKEAVDSRKLFVKMPVSVEVTGGYHTVALFFDEVSTMRQIVNITNLRMGSPKFVEGRAVIKTNFDLTAFAAP